MMSARPIRQFRQWCIDTSCKGLHVAAALTQSLSARRQPHVRCVIDTVLGHGLPVTASKRPGVAAPPFRFPPTVRCVPPVQLFSRAAVLSFELDGRPPATPVMLRADCGWNPRPGAPDSTSRRGAVVASSLRCRHLCPAPPCPRSASQQLPAGAPADPLACGHRGLAAANSPAEGGHRAGEGNRHRRRHTTTPRAGSCARGRLERRARRTGSSLGPGEVRRIRARQPRWQVDAGAVGSGPGRGSRFRRKR